MSDKRGATVLDDLPESIILCEILARLPPKDALRCSAVRKSWRRDTSIRNFLLAHHHHQPFLPVIKQSAGTKYRPPLDDPRLVLFHDAGTRNHKFWPVLHYVTPPLVHATLQLHLHDCRDGLLIISDSAAFSSHNRKRFFYVCNPVTRQCAPLPQLVEHGQQLFSTSIAGLYLHHPSGEYRLLYSRWSGPPNNNDEFYVMTIGSDEPRRFIGWPPPSPPPSLIQVWITQQGTCPNNDTPFFLGY